MIKISTTETRRELRYLHKARIEAGYANRTAASMRVNISPVAIGRHERGDVRVTPEDAILYANTYRRPDILIRYCSDCPVGQATCKSVTDRDLPTATLRLTARLRRTAEKIPDKLESIAVDNVKGATLSGVLAELDSLIGSILEYKLSAMGLE